jgi:cytochrome b involved in lipid metabolism
LVELFLQVYDVTPFVEEHPGGDAILNNAGGDSTVGFFGYFLCALNNRL